MIDRQKFAILRAARRVWAVGAIHGEAERLDRLHAELWPRLELCDRIVYLGNMIGRGSGSHEVVDTLLRFRLDVLAQPHSHVDDVVYLRGSQEEMWQKLLQLQFATDPRGVLRWMLEQGVGATLQSYGISAEDALRRATTGTVVLTRWTGRLREQIQAHPGHYQLMAALRRAAYTDDGALLFVNSGLDPSRPLEAQSDSFWWSSGKFHRIAEPYGGFRRIVRGFDPSHAGFSVTDYTVTLDGGCGFGGALIAACITADGAVIDKVEA
jgi:serine/threonine protein phosphatase 1